MSIPRLKMNDYIKSSLILCLQLLILDLKKKNGPQYFLNISFAFTSDNRHYASLPILDNNHNFKRIYPLSTPLGSDTTDLRIS